MERKIECNENYAVSRPIGDKDLGGSRRRKTRRRRTKKSKKSRKHRK